MPGSRSVAVTEPSPLAPVVPERRWSLPAGGAQDRSRRSRRRPGSSRVTRQVGERGVVEADGFTDVRIVGAVGGVVDRHRLVVRLDRGSRRAPSRGRCRRRTCSPSKQATPLALVALVTPLTVKLTPACGWSPVPSAACLRVFVTLIAPICSVLVKVQVTVSFGAHVDVGAPDCRRHRLHAGQSPSSLGRSRRRCSRCRQAPLSVHVEFDPPFFRRERLRAGVDGPPRRAVNAKRGVRRVGRRVGHLVDR